MTDGSKVEGRGVRFTRAAITLSFSAFMSAALYGCAEDELGSEWETETAATSPISLAAPGLDGGIERYFSTEATSRKYTEHVAIRVGPGGEYPRAELIFLALVAGYEWRREVDLASEVAGWSFFSNGEVKVGSERRTTNNIGKIRYAPFTYQDVSCVAFAQYWGHNAGDFLGSTGSRFLLGYYCGEPSRELSSTTISEVLRGIRIGA